MTYDGIERRGRDRADVRISARIASGMRVAFHGSAPDDDAITNVTISSLSNSGTTASATDDVIVGSIVTVEVPLVGWREAEVIWMAGGRAGCRFLEPLTSSEYAMVTAEVVASELFPHAADPTAEPRFVAERRAGLDALRGQAMVVAPDVIDAAPWGDEADDDDGSDEPYRAGVAHEIHLQVSVRVGHDGQIVSINAI